MAASIPDDRVIKRLAVVLWVVTLAFALGATVAVFAERDAWARAGFISVMVQSVNVIGGALVYSTFGTVITLRQPRNRLGWVLLGIGLSLGLTRAAAGYTFYAMNHHLLGFPPAVAAAWVQNWSFGLILPTGFALVLLLFPDGRPASPRWRWVVALAFWGTVLNATVGMVSSGPLTLQFPPGSIGSNDSPSVGISNPTGILPAAWLQSGPGAVLWASLVFTIPAGCASLVARFRRASGVERQQLKWIAVVGACIALGAVQFIYAAPDGPAYWVSRSLFFLMIASVVVGLPAATGIAILRYRLYDIDLVINKSLVYGFLGAFITAVYVGIVVGLGSLVGSGGRPNLLLSILATAVVALAFQPVRERVERVANRLVYGRRVSPYEVLSQFSGAYSSREILPRMAQVLAEGTGAIQASVWMRTEGGTRPVASWPEPVDGHLQRIDSEHSAEVRYQGRVLGRLALTKPPGEPLSGVEEGLLKDLAAQAGLVLHNLRLNADLEARLEQISAQAAELRESRRRIVAAQDQERRKLERNIHDGAQQHLVALAVKLRLAGTLAQRNPEKARQLLQELKEESELALQTLRDLARGIYPPLLRDQGLVAALGQHAPVTAEGVGRHHQELEAAVYFCCLEALQNVAKYAQTGEARVRLTEEDGILTFSVEDEGVGFDPALVRQGSGLRNMRDRIAAVGGDLEILGRPGRGTTVRGRIPVRAQEYVA